MFKETIFKERGKFLKENIWQEKIGRFNNTVLYIYIFNFY